MVTKMSALSPELSRAARNLEERCEILGADSKRIPLAEWDALAADVRQLIPDWMPELLSTYRIAGVWFQFESPNLQSGWDILGFLYPQEYATYFSEGSRPCELIGYGLIPFASNDANGSLWATTSKDGPNGKIYFIDHSGWGPGAPTKENGLDYAHSSLAVLMASLTIIK